MNIHPSTSTKEPTDENLKKIVDRFWAGFQKTNDGVKKRLLVENEDKGIWTPKLLVENFRIPITYDNLHHKCLPDGLTAEAAFKLCYRTWHRTGYFTPLFHYSESHPDKSNPRSHADMPVSKPDDYGMSFPVDYDIELKSKDHAIAALSI